MPTPTPPKHRLPRNVASPHSALVIAVIAGMAALYYPLANSENAEAEPIAKLANRADAPRTTTFDGQRSYGYLKALCNLGNRMSGSPGMKKQQALVEKHFTDLGATVTYQRFRAKHPLNGQGVPMANMIVEWRPEAKQRILLCAHYDTRPLPDREFNPRVRKQGVFVGANDGASGVALLMELGHHVAQLPLNYGLDFVLFDGEELVYFDGREDNGEYFLGSIWFAQNINSNRRSTSTSRVCCSTWWPTLS